MTIGEKVKEVIRKAGPDWDPIKVAAAIDMSTANLYRIFKRDSVETRYLEKISQLLAVPIEYFYADMGTNDPNYEKYGKPGTITRQASLLKEFEAEVAALKAELANNSEKLAMLEEKLADKEEMLKDKSEMLQHYRVLLQKN